MSLRSEELARKAIAAGYGNPASSVVGGANDPSSTVVCSAGAGVEFGDWVAVSSTSDGHPVAGAPGSDGDPAVMGVVLHTAGAGQFVKVQTAGIAIAKVAGTPSNGDMLQVNGGDTTAELYDDEEFGCGIYLAEVMTGYAWCRINVLSVGQGLFIHHHVDDEDTPVVDRSNNEKTGHLWHLFRVTDDQFTGGTPKLMLAIGGGDIHGISNGEGWAWGGVIGNSAQMGAGILGGENTNGKQGVLGMEVDKSASQNSGDWRVNLRSWAGVNTKDKMPNNGQVGPYLFINDLTLWRPPVACWQGENTCTGSNPGLAWWGGAFIWDAAAAPNNNTTWSGHHVPSMPVEINCITVDNCAYQCESETLPECIPLTLNTLVNNARDLNGSYENLIPWGYQVTANRLDELSAIGCLASHVGALWGTFHCLSIWLGTAIDCINNFFATKVDGSGAAGNCCPDPVLPPSMNCGPPTPADCAGNPFTCGG